MNELRIFLNSLPLVEQQNFANRCGTTINYLRKALSRNSTLGTELCVAIEKESKGVVTRKVLVSNWQARWPELV
ncbi:antirepressor protein Cro [Gallibacterium salpingitidis]|uniref:Antirepressor protein Cro n=1 Tax=Gallibacterium salpingitidis TaxID=505341 RepID=A0AB36E2H4_9PAST|nr:Cro/Cl family transcriptional regulator [Gallibacterium salpingitidis]OBX09583.1 antirepressor protein Cro [Gallibacterium salpingitidis]OBX10438.1 antirepressor protein Cro [Gallibacterium salpingitidis]